MRTPVKITEVGFYGPNAQPTVSKD